MSAREFDSEFELDILSAAVRSLDFTKQAMRLCEAHHFHTKEYSWVWGVVSDTYHKFGEVPHGKIFAARARDEFKDASKREPYLKLVSTVMKHKPAAPKSALDELEKFVRWVTAQTALEAAADAFERNDVDEVYKALGAVTKHTVGKRKYSLVNWIEEFEERQEARRYEKLHPDEITAIKTGWPTVDAITGGVRIGELFLIMGTTGRGKSIALNNIAHKAATMGHNVLSIGFEMPARQIAARQDSRMFQIEYKKLKEFDLSPSELREITTRLERAKKHLAGRIKIASFPVRSATINDVKGLIDDLKVEQDWTPKVIILDSADHLKALETTKEAYRLQQAEVYWQAKALGEDDGYAMFSSMHASAQWAGATATAEAAAESYEKSRIADAVVSINDPSYSGKKKSRKPKVEGADGDDFDSDEDKDETEVVDKRVRNMELFLAKYRDGESNRIIPVRCDFTKMLIEEVAKPT